MQPYCALLKIRKKKKIADISVFDMALNFAIVVFCSMIHAVVMQRDLALSPMVINGPGIGRVCPSLGIRQAARRLLQGNIHNFIYGGPVPECGPGNWRRVFYLNASEPEQLCPGDWTTVTSPVRGCAGADSTCRSAFSEDISAVYSKVCGRVIGEGRTSPDAFFRYLTGQTTIEHNYLDGVSITAGASGSRTHIWTFGAGHGGSSPRCPCDNNNRFHAPLPPAGVGENYFCDRSDGLDNLWTGESCGVDNPCCSFHNPPFFNVQLSAASADRIELRICSDQHQGDETILVLVAEIYVQ